MLFFGIVALALFNPILTWKISDLFDGKCDKFEKEQPFCLALQRNDIQRTYASWTTYDQSTRLSGSNYVDLSKKCTPVMFYLVSRHAARYPNVRDMNEMSELLPKLQAELSESYDRRLDELCSHDFAAIREWRFKMNPAEAGHVAPSGVKATKNMARLFHYQYPTLFNPRTVDFQVSVANRHRTFETAEAFIDGIRDNQPKIGEKIKIQTRDHLEFNKICLKKIGIREPAPKELEDITQSELFNKLRRRVSQRMGFRRTITDRELRVMHKACSIEQAVYNYAPWCALFTKPELDALEIREDVAEYYKNGPGSQISKRMACPLVANLYSAVTQAIRNPETRNTHLQFADSAAITRLMNMLNVHSNLDLHKNYCPKSTHSFQTSSILPLNANFNAVLYRCSPDPDTTNPGDFKLLTMINGNPVEIEKCKDEACKATTFLNEYRQLARGCDLDELCPQMQAIDESFDDEE